MKLLWFTAPWCRPCKNMVPVIDELQDELPGLLIEKINVSEADRGRPGDGLMAEAFGVQAVPTFIFIKPDGTEINRVVGGTTKAKLLELLSK